MKKTRVVIGLSGGVDSAVSAALLRHAGYDVTGVFLKVFEGESGILAECPWREDLSAAEDIASFLNIPFESWNFTKQYRTDVLSNFFSELKNNRTPNPDVLCNNAIKFGIFLRTALLKSFDFVATGHYAKTICLRNKQMILERGADLQKDQSYFLCRLTQDMLSRVLFPIGCMRKSKVRHLAHTLHLPHADRKDSQGMCFVGKININDFISHHVVLTPGPIITTDGKRIGTHNGLPLYTIGQRQGIRIGGNEEPLYVVKKESASHALIVASGDSHPALFSTEAILQDIQWINKKPEFPTLVDTQIRYRQQPVKATIKQYGGNIHIVFQEPQRAVTPGQYCVLYNQERLLGSGIISEQLK